MKNIVAIAILSLTLGGCASDPLKLREINQEPPLSRVGSGLPAAPVMMEVPALEDGFVTAIDGEVLGHAVVHLGGGRLREGDRVNPSVGLSDLAGLGEEAGAGVPLAMVHAMTEEAARAAVQAVQAAYRIGAAPPSEPDLVLKRIA